MVNAAKHAEVGEVSLYAEVEPDAVHVFVRDRGIGFDPAAVPDDRHGLVDSVQGRMGRHGGSASLRSAPGEGTEVHLEMPREGAPEPPRGAEPRGIESRGAESRGTESRGFESRGTESRNGLDRGAQRTEHRAEERAEQRAEQQALKERHD